MMSDESPLTLLLMPPPPSKKEYIADASRLISEHFDFEEELVDTLLWECHEQLISDMSLVLHNPLAFTSAERPLNDHVDIYHRAEKVGRRISYGIYLRSPDEEDDKLVGLTRIQTWNEFLPEVEQFD